MFKFLIHYYWGNRKIKGWFGVLFIFSLYDPSALETPSLWSKGSAEKIQIPVGNE